MHGVLGSLLGIALAACPAWVHADEEAERLTQLLALKPGARVGEIGAGDGAMAIAIAQRVAPPGRVFATELEAEARSTIAANARAAGVANLEVREAGLRATGLSEGCCDAIFMRNVYHHLGDPQAIAADLLRAHVPGGTLVVIDFPPTWYLLPWSPEGVGAERTGHGITRAAALRELEAAGFARVEVVEPWADRWFAGDAYALKLRAPPR